MPAKTSEVESALSSTYETTCRQAEGGIALLLHLAHELHGEGRHLAVCTSCPLNYKYFLPGAQLPRSEPQQRARLKHIRSQLERAAANPTLGSSIPCHTDEHWQAWAVQKQCNSHMGHMGQIPGAAPRGPLRPRWPERPSTPVDSQRSVDSLGYGIRWRRLGWMQIGPSALQRRPFALTRAICLTSGVAHSTGSAVAGSDTTSSRATLAQHLANNAHIRTHACTPIPFLLKLRRVRHDWCKCNFIRNLIRVGKCHIGVIASHSSLNTPLRTSSL